MADNKKNKHKNWQIKRRRIKYRIRQKNRNDYPRLVVYRSNTNIYAQLVDDLKMTTILSASSIDKDLKDSIIKAANKIEKSKIVGVAIAEKIKNAKIDKIIIDRNGYKYHGRVKALTEAIRSADITI
jgi:large subunit ribosomal protein L18